MNFLENIFSIKNENEHKVIKIFGIKVKYFDKFNYYNKNPDKLKMFTKRNIERNASIQYFGLHRLKPTKYPQYFESEIRACFLLKEKFEYFILGHVNIPQIEFTLTTNCTLKCKNCTNYIPRLEKDENRNISFEEFKSYLDNLTNSVNKIYNLLLIGGEPLLVRNLDKYLDYAAKNKKVKNVWITTNGTLLMSDELLKVVKKHHKKVTIWVSNYSKNEALSPILKHDKLLEQIKTTNAELIYNEDLYWKFVTEEIKLYKRSKSDNIKYFKTCLHSCLSVFEDKLYVCPRAGVFYLKKLYNLEKSESVSLKNKNKKRLKKDIIEFYSRNYFGACNFCNVLSDRKEVIMPAIQLEVKQ